MRYGIFILYHLQTEFRPRPLGPRRNRWVACVSRQSFESTDQPSDRLLVNHSCLSLPRKCGLVKPSIHILGGYIYEAHFECHDILMLGKSPIKWRQRPDITIAVDWDVKHQFKETNEFLQHLSQYF